MFMTTTIRTTATPFGNSWAVLSGPDPDHPDTVHQYYCFADAYKEASRRLLEAEFEPCSTDDPYIAATKRRAKKPPSSVK